MKRRQLDDLKTKDHSALTKLTGELRASIIQAKLEVTIGKLKNTAQVRNLKKQLALVNTLLKQKQTQ